METPQSPHTHLSGPVLILGTGLLGASIGLGLRAQGIDVVLSDPSPSAQAVAVDIGAGRPLRTAGTTAAAGLTTAAAGLGTAAAGLGTAAAGLAPELVVVAAPPDVTASVAAGALADYPDAVVVDIASVKASILAELIDAGADLSRYVGTHPMAGREKSGPVAARAELFTSMPWVLCATEHSTAGAVKTAGALALDLGAIVARMPAEEHDQSVALISHLPQVLSSLVASRLQETPPQALSLAGQGLRDVTRIAASDPSLWVQILGANAPRLLGVLHGVREDLNRLIGTLEDPTAPGARLDLAQLMSEGNAGQARIPGKHGAPPRAFAEVTVLVDDTPGQIARLLTEIGDIGVNLEDLRLEHSPGQEVGLAEVSVLPSKRNELIEALTERGWKVVS